MTRLSDAVGASGLAGYAIVALVMFLIAFVLVLIPIFAPARRATYDRASMMPFDDDTSPAPGAPENR
ncbi:MAG: cbb3-type cytochrome oxidase subunit 3 [Gemmatimonadales bacterium]